jgi:putative transposase
MIAEMVRIQNEGLWGVYLYCIMLDHIHLVANAGRLGLSKAVMRFKGRVATWWRRNGDGQPLWQSGYFDHRIRHAEGFRDKCSYILQNPVRAGLVVQAEDYAWSGSLTQR